MKVPKVFVCIFQIIAMTKICITFYQVTPDITSYHALSLLITPYHTLSPRLEAKPFSFGNFLISSQAPTLLSHLITPYHTLSPRLKAKLLSFGNFEIRFQSPNFLSLLITPCHILSHLIIPYPPDWKEIVFNWQF